MKWLDEKRPQINGQPAYGDGAGLGVLPYLEMMPKSNGLTLIRVLLATDYNTFGEFSNFVDTRMVPNHLEEYHKDPEEFFKKFFDYEPPGAAKMEKAKQAAAVRPGLKPIATMSPTARSRSIKPASDAGKSQLSLEDFL